MKFSLVIPCYNEAENIPLLLERCKILTVLPDIEIILVDNGSTDNSPAVFEKLLPHYPGCHTVRVDHNQGYGFGILAGLKASKGTILGWTHADMQTDPNDVLEGLKFFDQYGLDIFVKGQRCGRSLTDVFFTIGMSLFETCLLGKAMWDINAQPTMFSKTFFETWSNPPYDFSLDLYAYYQAKMYKMSVYRFPVHFGERAHGISNWNVDWQSKKKFIKRTINFSLKLRQGLK